ncbi:hypothetical protein QQX98_003229 [Neonectria punicea]|uniref:SnoaL-like domain-containing protein n=1 Tax=Neonectria punicea TaxID=979145 RepID=A0ABR1HEM3_9HYPO
MAYLNANSGFPPLPNTTSLQVTAEERSSAIDFVNRINTLFEEFDQDMISSTFLPDASLRHAYGTFRGRAELEGFTRKIYLPLIPGVSRHATNHIVDRDEETGAVVVRYHNLLVRHIWAEDAGKVTTKGAIMVTDDLPRIWFWLTTLDRLKMTDEGWRVQERIIGATVINKDLDSKSGPKA